jgi:hypothetical protein
MPRKAAAQKPEATATSGTAANKRAAADLPEENKEEILHAPKRKEFDSPQSDAVVDEKDEDAEKVAPGKPAVSVDDDDRDVRTRIPEENAEELERIPDRPEFDAFDDALNEAVDTEDQNNHLGDGDDEIADYRDHSPALLVSSFAQTPDEPVVSWADAAAENQRIQEELIQKAVQDALNKMGLQNRDEAPKSDFVPHKFRYHFRNDVNPSVKIQAMDMSALDRGERPQDNPLYGHWYEFHVGHFQTDDENAARQMKWMMNNVPVDAAGQTVGGNLAIYEDDNSVIFRCPQCDFVTASPSGYKAHRRATHGEV